jgi:hypothetical protein
MRPSCLEKLNLFGLLLASTALSADALTTSARIGVYFDAAGTQCTGSIVPGVPSTVYIVAKANAADRVSGAEFRFLGLPAQWSVFPVPNPTTLSLGNPFANGVNIAATGFSTECTTAGDQVFLLYTVAVLATDHIENVRFSIAKRDPPLNPAFACPLITTCDVGDGFVKHCVETDDCFVNATSPVPCATTAVHAVSWSAVRGLYH